MKTFPKVFQVIHDFLSDLWTTEEISFAVRGPSSRSARI